MSLIQINLNQPTKRVYRRDERDPWIEGYEARRAYIARTANPYRGLDTQPLWDDGWMVAEGEAGKPARPVGTHHW